MQNLSKGNNCEITDKCVIHLVDSSKFKYIDVDLLEMCRIELEDELLDFYSKIKEGDLVEDVARSGYRCSGVYVINKYLDISSLNDNYDDYGNPPLELSNFIDIPKDYYDKTNMIIKRHNVDESINSEFYWHYADEGSFMNINTKKIDLKEYGILYDSHLEYIIFKINNIKYLICQSQENMISLNQQIKDNNLFSVYTNVPNILKDRFQNINYENMFYFNYM